MEAGASPCPASRVPRRGMLREDDEALTKFRQARQDESGELVAVISRPDASLPEGRPRFGLQ
jgi:hypothetical protein